MEAETLVVSWFRFLRVGSRISELRVIILPGTQILKVGSRISDCSQFCFLFLKFYVAPSHITRLGATRNEKHFFDSRVNLNNYIKVFVPNRIKTTRPDNEVNFCI